MKIHHTLKLVAVTAIMALSANLFAQDTTIESVVNEAVATI